MTPHDLQEWQRCHRLPQLRKNYDPIRLGPRTAFDRVFQKSLREGLSPETAAVEFLEIAANRGLDTAEDPFRLAQDYAATLQTALTKIRVSYPGPFLRWVVTRNLPQNVLYREIHSWETVVPMASDPGKSAKLAFLLLGSEGHGHLHSSWCRVYKHPAIAQRYKFQLVNPDGTTEPLRGKEWKPVWYQDLKSQTPQGWVEMMDADRICPIHIVELKPFSAQKAKEVLRDYHMASIDFLNSDAWWEELPMTRGACDFPSQCPYQGLCYTTSTNGLVQLDSSLAAP